VESGGELNCSRAKTKASFGATNPRDCQKTLRNGLWADKWLMVEFGHTVFSLSTPLSSF